MADGTFGLIAAVMMLAAFALLAGGVHLMRAPTTRTRGVLMLVCALVLVGNVVILTVPVPG